MKRSVMRNILHFLVRIYGEIAYRCGRDRGYYWALRATCNWARLDWYGRPCPKTFVRVGWIQW